MKQTHYTTRVLTPDEGCFLTQAADVPAAERIVSDCIYLAANDSPDNWKEITADEAQAITEARAEALSRARAEAMASVEPSESDTDAV